MQANRKYIYVSEKAPIYMLPNSKAPNCSKFRVTDIGEQPADFFFWHLTTVDFSSRNYFTNCGSFAKIFVPVETIIPWLVKRIKVSTGTETFAKEPKLVKYMVRI